MGVDFIHKAAKSFHKGLDTSRIELATPDLFTRYPDREPRAYAAKIRRDKQVNCGEDLCVLFHGSKIIAQRGMEVVAEFTAPPPELVEALKKSHGEACGTVLEFYEVAGIAEITVC